MVAQKKEEVPKDEKSELDLGIEESIRRCEALLSMVPISLQPILADGMYILTLISLWFHPFVCTYEVG